MSDKSQGHIPADEKTFEANREDYSYLERVVRQGNTRAARKLIQRHREDVMGKAAEMENLARENNHPTIAKLFRDFLTGSLPLYNFTPSANPGKYEVWMKTSMRKLRNERYRIRMLCFSSLNLAQGMGLLEQRNVWSSGVEIRLKLPINTDLCPSNYYLGRYPTFAGKHPDANAGFCCMTAAQGTPRYEELMSRELNRLSQEKLWWLAKRMARSLDERTALHRAMAVVDYDTQKIEPAVLTYFFGNNGPFRADLPLHANAIKDLVAHKPQIISPCLGPTLLAVVL